MLIRSQSLPRSSSNLDLIKADLKLKNEVIYTHEAAVTTVTFSKRSHYIASGAADGTIMIYSLLNNTVLHTIKGAHSASINQIQFCAADRWIISCSEDGSIKVFDYRSKSNLATVDHAHEGCINTIALSKQEDIIATASADCSVKLFDLENQELIHHFEELHEKSVVDVCFTPNGKFIISTSEDMLIKITDIERKKIVTVFYELHEDVINKIDCTPDGKYLITASNDRSIKVVDIEKKELIYTFENAHDLAVNHFALSSNGVYATSVSQDGSLKIFNIYSKQFIIGFESVHSDIINQVAVSSDGTMLVTASQDKSVKLFSLGHKPVLKHIKNAHQKTINSVEISSSGLYMATSSDDNSIGLYNLVTLENICTIKDAHEGAINSVVFSPDEKYIISCSNDRKIKIFNREDPSLVETIDNSHEGPIKNIKITPDRKYIVSSSWDCSIEVFDFESKEHVFSFEHAHEDPITSMVVSNKGDWVITGSLDKSIRIHELGTFKRIYSFDNAHEHYIHAVAISSNDKYIASGSSDKAVSLFGTERLEKIYSFENAHKNVVTSVVFTHDCRFLISASVDRAIMVYDVSRLEKIHRIHSAHNSAITSLAVSPDSNKLVSVSEDCSIKVHHFCFGDPKMISVVELGSKNAFSIFSFVKLAKFREARSDSRKIPLLKECAQIVVYPHGYNMFHIMCLKRPSIAQLKACIDLNIPFTHGFDGMTPLHFLFMANETTLVNHIFQKASTVFPKVSDETFEKLSDIIGNILQTNSPYLQKFFGFGVGVPRTCADKPLTRFGKLKAGGRNYNIFESRVLTKARRDKLMKKGTNPVSVVALRFKIHRNFDSKENFDLIIAMYTCKNPNVFQTKCLQLIIDYNWRLSQKYIWTISILFYTFLTLLSIYSQLWFQNLAAEIVLFGFNTFFLLYELIQASSRAKIYFAQLWNYFDLGRILLLYAFLIDSWSGGEQYELMGILSFVIFLSYLKALSYLRAINKMRNLVRLVMDISWDMASFTFVSTIIIICFALIFKLYNDQESFGVVLILTYRAVFGDFNTDDYGVIEYIMFVLHSILVGVTMLQLLIAIMEDSFEKILDTAISADNSEKLAMILETLQELRTLRRICWRRKERRLMKEGDENRGFLFRVANSKGISENQWVQEYEDQPFEGKIHTLKKQMRTVSSYLKSEIFKLDKDIKKDLGKKLKQEMEQLSKEFKEQLTVDLKEEIKEEFDRETENIKYLLQGVNIKKRESQDNSFDFNGLQLGRKYSSSRASGLESMTPMRRNSRNIQLEELEALKRLGSYFPRAREDEDDNKIKARQSRPAEVEPSSQQDGLEIPKQKLPIPGEDVEKRRGSKLLDPAALEALLKGAQAIHLNVESLKPKEQQSEDSDDGSPSR